MKAHTHDEKDEILVEHLIYVCPDDLGEPGDSAAKFFKTMPILLTEAGMDPEQASMELAVVEGEARLLFRRKGP